MVDMQPSSMIGSGPVQGVSSPTSCMSNASQIASLHAPMLSHEQHQHLASQQHLLQQHYEQNGQHPQQNIDDFLEQMFLMPWEINANNSQQSQSQKLFTMSLLPHQEPGSENNLQYGYEESALLASRLRQHELGENVGMNMGGNHVSEGMNDSNSSPGRSMMLQLSTGNPNSPQLMNTMSNSPRGPVTSPPQLPLSLGQGKPGDINENAREGFFPPFQGSARGARPPNFQPQLQQIPSFGSMPQQQQQHTNPPATSPVGAPPTRPRVRARRGQATDPHSIAERLRRERIAERMKQLQELVPNSNKTDKASMLDEIIDYVKFLQLQVKVLSMSRLGGAGAVAPLVADVPKEGGNGQAARSNGAQNNSADGMALTERQVAKLMEEDMGSAMQYLQGKGLCLMPISLASAISSTNKTSMQSQQQKQASLQALLSGNANVGNEQTTSSLSAITTISSPTDLTASENAKHVSREANSTTKTNE